MSWFLAFWCKFRKAKRYFNNYWLGIVKNRWGLIDHGALKSSISHKWFDELSRLVEIFLCAVIFEWCNNNVRFDGQSTLYLWYLNDGGPQQLYFAGFFNKNSLWAKITKYSQKWPKIWFSLYFEKNVINLCWKHTFDIVIYFTVQIPYLGKFLFLSYEWITLIYCMNTDNQKKK